MIDSFQFSVFSEQLSVGSAAKLMRRRCLLFTVFCLLFVAGCSGSSADRDPLVLYLWRDSADIHQLYLTTLEGNSTQLTQSTNHIREYAVAPNGEAVAYIESTSTGATQLWVMRDPRGGGDAPEMPIDCSDQQCRGPVWANDSRRLIFEQRDLSGNSPRLWWLDTQTGETVPVFSDEAIVGYGARFSADNNQISYIQIIAPDDVAQQLPPGHSIGDGHNHQLGASGPQQIIKLFNFTTGQEKSIPNLMNAYGTWHPEKPELLLTDMQFYGERFGVHVMHVDSAESKVTDYAPNTMVEDSSPVWSPDGALIAFGRKQSQAPMGAQLWLMQADGSDPRALSQDTNIHHGLLSWRADGAAILFQRFDISQPSSDPAIWFHDVSAESPQQIVPQGFLPAWLP